MAPWEDYLKTIYYDPKHAGSFSGPQKLTQWRKAKDSLTLVCIEYVSFCMTKNHTVFINLSEDGF